MRRYLLSLMSGLALVSASFWLAFDTSDTHDYIAVIVFLLGVSLVCYSAIEIGEPQ